MKKGAERERVRRAGRETDRQRSTLDTEGRFMNEFEFYILSTHAKPKMT